MSSRPSTSRVVALLALGYLALGLAGLAVAIPPGYASPVFPAAGLALAVVLRQGLRAVPGVWIGSAALNVAHVALAGTLSPLAAGVAVLIGAGAAAQAAAGAWLVLHFQGDGWRKMEREQDALAFMVLGGLAAGLVSPTLGVTVLQAAGIVGPAEVLYSWWTWYVGDALGVLIVAPVAFCFVSPVDALWRERRRRIVPPVLLTLVAVTLAFGGVSRWEREVEAAQVAADGERIERRIADRLLTQREVLASLRNFAEVTPDFTFAQFEQFTRSALADNPDVFAVSFNDLLPDALRADFERRMGELSPLGRYQVTERGPDGKLVRAAVRPEYVPVRTIVPLDGNRAAVGFDIHSEPVRRAAIERARATGAFAVTSPIRLVQEQRERVGILELLPVRRLPPGGGVAAELLGFAVAVVKVDEMIEVATRGAVPAGVTFRLTDPQAPEDRQVLHQAGPAIDPRPPPGSSWSRTIPVGGRQWLLSVYVTGEHLEEHRAWLAWAIGPAGLLLATLFQVLMLGMTGRAAVIERKNADLRASQARLLLADSVFENSGSSIVVTDPEGVVVASNPAFTTVTGYGADEVRGRNMRIVNSGRHPRSFFEDMWRRLREEHRWQGEIWNRRKSGEVYVEWLTIAAVLDDRGAVTHYVGSFVDLSERRALEERVARATRLAALGTLVAGVAHEVNNPLTGAMALQGSAMEDLREVASDVRKGGADPEAVAARIDEVRELVAEAQTASERIARVVRDLTLLGRPEPQRTRIRLAGVVEDALRWMPPAVTRGIAIEVRDATAPDVEGSAGQLAQVVINLVANGARAIPDGRPGCVEIHIGPGETGFARIEVSDNGGGMSAEVQKRIFDPFFTTRRVGEGTGLGLPICHSIVTAHGGTIAVVETSPEGTTFRVELPAAGASPGPAR